MRRAFLFLAFALLAACAEQPRHRVVILGVDGMDHRLTQEMLAQGDLPNLQALAAAGGFSSLGTSIPPESPVAWSNFITGRNPGGHGVFDFIHPEWVKGEDGGHTFVWADPIASAEEVGWELPLFGYCIPLTGGDPINKRRGTAFWDILEEHGVPATIYKIPANYPPTPTGQQTLSGMGTPDVQGGYGTFYLYTDDPFAVSGEIVSGKLITVSIYENTVREYLYGPDNTLVALEPGEHAPATRVPFRVDLDPEQPLARIRVGEDDGEQAVLKEGEWSDFLEVDFDIIPHVTGVTGLVRFHLQQVRPTFRLYVDPINISPFEPAMEISTPSDWVTELAERNGPFLTKGMPENTKALEEGVLTQDEVREHSLGIYEQDKRVLFDLLSRQDSGLLFHYFGSVDLNSHVFWRCMDEKHPGHAADTSNANEQFIRWLYRDIDAVVGRVRAELGPDDTLIVMSDHGFAPFYRAFNLNTWLLEHGYAVLREQDARGNAIDREAAKLLSAVDWSKTRAYNLGFAGIYLNVRGRDPLGIVEPAAVADLVDEICFRLMQETDPKNGEPIFLTMYKTREVYSGEAKERAPDIVAGFRREYRNSDESTQGMFPEWLIQDNMDAWSGCHLMAAEEVPGVLFVNRAIRRDAPQLYDLTATILSEYGIERPADMVGWPVWDAAQAP
ncbi:MAG: alkaline phosphatase family protein [Planctomycetes bacterium]|nr:alkaline phosphatase family protein [Planctomycetota bacterium]